MNQTTESYLLFNSECYASLKPYCLKPYCAHFPANPGGFKFKKQENFLNLIEVHIISMFITSIQIQNHQNRRYTLNLYLSILK